MQPAVGDEKHLPVALLAVDDAREIDTRLPHQIAPKFDAKRSFGQHNRQRGQLLAQRLADSSKIKRHIARKIGNAEAASQIASGQRRAAFFRQPRRERQGRSLHFRNGGGIQRLAASIYVKAAPFAARCNQAACQRGHSCGIHAKLLGPAAHLHARSLEIEIRIDPDGKARDAAQPIPNRQCTLCLSRRFKI